MSVDDTSSILVFTSRDMFYPTNIDNFEGLVSPDSIVSIKFGNTTMYTAVNTKATTGVRA
jgi:hypothetical protein